MIPLPEVSGNRIKLTPEGYLKAILAVIFIVTLIVLYVFQLRHFNKILNPGFFLLLSGLIGLILGLGIARKYSQEVKDTYEKMRIYMLCIVLSVAFAPLLVSLANRYLDFKTVQYKEAQLLSIGARTDQPFGYTKGEKLKVTNFDMVLLIDEKVYEIRNATNPFPGKKAGSIVQVPVQQGLLEINYLDF